MSMNLDEEWRDRAACLGKPAELFFPEHAGETSAEAKALCASCPVREPCLKFALETGQEHGYWGGASERKRRRIRKAAAMSRRRAPRSGEEAVGW